MEHAIQSSNGEGFTGGTIWFYSNESDPARCRAIDEKYAAAKDEALMEGIVGLTRDQQHQQAGSEEEPSPEAAAGIAPGVRFDHVVEAQEDGDKEGEDKEEEEEELPFVLYEHTKTDLVLAQAYCRFRCAEVVHTNPEAKGPFHINRPQERLWKPSYVYDVKHDFGVVMGLRARKEQRRAKVELDAADAQLRLAQARVKGGDTSKAAKDAAEAAQDCVNEREKEAEAWGKVVGRVEGNAQRTRCMPDIQATLTDLTLIDKLDGDPDLIAAQGGVAINLRTGEAVPRTREHLCTFEASAEYQGVDHATPYIDAWMSDIFLGNTELIAYFQRLMGYAITGHATEQIFALFTGDGENSKGVFYRALRNLLGKFYVQMDGDCVLKKTFQASAGSHSDHLFKLVGSRIAVLNETESEDTLSERAVKQLAGGGDAVAVRAIHQSSTDLVPTFLPILVSNHLPRLKIDHATKRRLVVIPFNCQFRGAADYDGTNKMHRKADPGIDAKLDQPENRSQLLSWLVRGAVAWYQEPDLKSTKPAAVANFTDDYVADNDDLQAFLDACVATGLDREQRVTPAALYEAYSEFDDGEPKLERRAFTSHLKNKGFRQVDTGSLKDKVDSVDCTFKERQRNTHVRCFAGLRLRQAPNQGHL